MKKKKQPQRKNLRKPKTRKTNISVCISKADAEAFMKDSEPIEVSNLDFRYSSASTGKIYQGQVFVVEHYT